MSELRTVFQCYPPPDVTLKSAADVCGDEYYKVRLGKNGKAIAIAFTEKEAHLIAAAPEQNRALVAMIQAFTRHPGNEDERHHALTLAHAVIAKADLPQSGADPKTGESE